MEVFINNLRKNKKNLKIVGKLRNFGKYNPIHNPILYPVLLFLLSFPFLVFSGEVLADFAVRSEYQSPLPYGNAETVRFHRAINNQVPLTPQEEEELRIQIPQKESGRYYGRVGVNFSTLTLGSLKNRSKGLDAPGIVSRTRVTKGQMGIELAFGYVWSPTVR